jgi:DNA polymerase
VEEARRLAYLRAMGVIPWVPRGTAPLRAGLAAAAPEAAVLTVHEVSAASAEPAREGSDPEPPPPAVAQEQFAEGGTASLDWEALTSAVAQCRACGLCETRTQTVFGVGDRRAELLVIGEAPGADEDREGEPFVGRAGQLLNRMLGAIGLSRQEVYIANILKCRPPGNRDPRPEEVLRCEPYLMRQIEMLRPRVILAVGRIAAQTLLRTDLTLGRLRGRWLELGPESIPLRVTYHPAYLLRSPDQKAKAWEDLTEVMRRLAGPT